MQKIDHDKFRFIFQGDFGTFQPAHLDGLQSLLSFLEADALIADPRQAAYMIATAMHETALTFLPIAEYGKGAGHPYGVIDPVTGLVYYGRGFVQLTWPGNYKSMGLKIGVDLYHEPDLAMEPENAYRVMSEGMRLGMFTGVSLEHFISGTECDYLNARKIINGLDCATIIAGYADKIAAALGQAGA